MYSIRMRTGGRGKRQRGDYELQLYKTIMSRKKNDGSPYSEKSVQTFVNNIQKISTHFLGAAEVFTNLKFLEDAPAVLKYLENHKTSNGYNYSIQTKWAMIQSIIISMNAEGYDETHLKPYWDARDIFKLMKEKKLSNGDTYDTATSKNQQAVLQDVCCDDIHKCIDKLNESKSQKDKTCAMMLQIHTEFPFRNDLADVKTTDQKHYEMIVNKGDDKLHNWLMLTDDGGYVFILNKFKTQKRYGTIIGEVKNKKTIQMLDDYILGDAVGQYLFKKDTGEPYTRNNISVLFTTTTKKHIGKPISTTLLAKIFNDTPTDYKEWTIDDFNKLKQRAYLRGHQPSTNITYYTRAS